jgi:hypothetical protein
MLRRLGNAYVGNTITIKNSISFLRIGHVRAPQRNWGTRQRSLRRVMSANMAHVITDPVSVIVAALVAILRMPFDIAVCN